MTWSLLAYSPHALLIGFGGEGDIILIFWRGRFIATPTKPLVEFKSPLVIAGFLTCFGITGTLVVSCDEVSAHD